MKIQLICVILLCILAIGAYATAPAQIPFQASGFRYANGTLVSVGSVATYVYSVPMGGVAIYTETFPTGLNAGYISVTMGANKTSNPLNLDWGATYYLAVSIDGTPLTMVDTYGSSSTRQNFTATQGEIVQLTQVNASLVTQTLRIDSLNNTILGMSSYSLAQIAANIGNWTLDKISYASTSWVTNYISAMSNLTLSQISANIGNWTFDKPSYATIAYANGINNLTYSLIVTNIGNFSAENSTIVRNGTKTCAAGTSLQNVTGNSSGLYGDCVAVSSSSGFQTNASIGMYFNKTTMTYTGSLTSGTLVGYLAGHAICNATYQGTHFCSQEEVIETMWHANVSTMITWSGTAWVNSGAPKYAPATTPVNDCNGWTSAVAASYLGNYWAFSTTGGGVGATINCGTSVALACCGVG